MSLRWLRRKAAFSLLFLVCSILAWRAARGEDWPQFRGPGGQGHSAAAGLPLTWSEKDNVAWKTPIPGLGWSSPVIRGGKVWLTTALDGGRSLRALAIDAGSGKLLREVEVFAVESPGSIHAKNSHASPTPLLEEDRVYVHYGAHGTACLREDGEVLWSARLEYAHGHGPGGSPVLFEDLLLVSCDGTDVQFVAALDKVTGDVRWKRDRPGRMAYSTPLMIEVEGRPQLLSTGGGRAVAYAPRSGEELWWCTYDGYSLVPRPVAAHGLAFIATGYDSPSLLAVRLGGKGDVTGTHIAWRTSRGVPHNPSPIIIGDELYMVSDGGVASCLDARSGRLHWQERLGAQHSASPLHAGGRIHFLSETAATTIIAPGTTFRRLAFNELEGRSLASMAVWEKAIFLRTDRFLYRLEER
jgi:outer membrane protein assembly factor BamB